MGRHVRQCHQVHLSHPALQRDCSLLNSWIDLLFHFHQLFPFPGNFKRCSTHPSTSFHIKKLKQFFQMKQQLTCISSNLVQSIQCSQCGLLHNGENRCRSCDIFAEHLRSVYRDISAQLLIIFMLNPTLNCGLDSATILTPV